MTAADDNQSPATPADHAAAPEPVCIEAVYRAGLIEPLAPLGVPAGTPVSLQLTPGAVVQPALVQTPARQRNWLRRIGSRHRQPLAPAMMPTPLRRPDVALLLGGLLVYALTRLLGLERFPIFFFSDEAMHATLAEQLLQNRFSDGNGTFLPPYFLNGGRWCLALSVYIHTIGVALFGKSVLVVRAVSVICGMLGVMAVALSLRQIFKLRLWWTAPLIMAALPVWFLHSRTAFESALMVACYACFLLAYLLYRYRSPRYLPLALVFGAATFYSYTNGQGVMLASGVLLLCSDLRFHLRQSPRTLLLALAIALVLALPYVRFRMLHADAVSAQLSVLDSYWLQNTSLGTKLATFGTTYLQGLSPGYWFVPNLSDLDRHQMKGMGHLSLPALPFVLLGLAVCLRQWRSPAHRAVLIAVLAAPFSAALVGMLVMRTLTMVVPATLLICIGLEQLRDWTPRRVPARALAIGCGTILLLLNGVVLRAALVNGPTWFEDYGMYGMQFGAAQVFGASRDVLERAPATRILISPNWANNTDVFREFFLRQAERERVSFKSIDSLLFEREPLTPDQLFVLPREEYATALGSTKLVVQPPERIVRYPDGRAGFFFVRIGYSDDAEAIFAAERIERQHPDEGTVKLDGQTVVVRYSKIDAGTLEHLFDDDEGSVIRGLEANPLVLEFEFPTPRTLRGLKLQTATMDYTLTVERTLEDGTQAPSATATYRNLPADPTVDFALPDGGAEISRLRIEITDLAARNRYHIHVRKLGFY